LVEGKVGAEALILISTESILEDGLGLYSEILIVSFLTSFFTSLVLENDLIGLA